MANERPQWDAYRALMAGRLIGLDNHPGVRPVRVGKTWWRMMEKCVLKVTGQEEKEACGTEKLFGGMDAVTEGGVHELRLL